MKIVLNLVEVGEILVKHLCKIGKLEKAPVTNLEWHVYRHSLQDSYVEIEIKQ